MIKEIRCPQIIWLLLLLLPKYQSHAQSNPRFMTVSSSDIKIEEPASIPSLWTYSDCLDWAIAYNTDIRQSLLSILQADEDILQAQDAWLPTVDASTTQGYNNYPVGKTGDYHNLYNSSYGVNAAWTIWEGNLRKYRLESAKLLRRQQQLVGEDVIKDLQVGVLQAYLNILYSHEAIEIARQTLEVSSAQVARMRKLVEAGRQSKVDLAQLESQMAQDEYNLTQAKTSLASNKMTLKKLLALGLDKDIDVVTLQFSDNEIGLQLPPMQSTFDAAVAWLPSFRNNDISREIYAQDVKIAEASNAPNISLQGGVGTGYNSGGRDWGYQIGHRLNENLNLTLSVPIYDANKKKRAVAKAKLAEMEADISRQQLLNDLSQTIESLYIQATNSKAKFESGKVQLEAMQTTSNLVNRQFELGLVNPLDLLTAHNNLLNARLEQLQNKYMAILANKTIQFYASQQVQMP